MKDEIVLRWVKKAEEDLRVSEHLLNVETPPTGAICFHCQQAVEKYLKAYLTYQNVRAGKTHDLVNILNLCIKQDKDFEKLDKDKISSLSFYSVEIRYPDEFYIPKIEEAKESFKIVLKVKDFVFRKLRIKVEDLR